MIRILKIAFFVLPILALGGFAVLTQAGTEHNVTGWAWSDQIGWISFNSLNTEGLPEAECEYGDVDTQTCTSEGENNCGQTANGIQTKICKPDSSWPESWGACSADTPADVIFNDCEACSNCPGDCDVQIATCANPDPVCVAPLNKVWDAECQTCAGGTVSSVANGTLCGVDGTCINGACIGATETETIISATPLEVVNGEEVTITVSDISSPIGTNINKVQIWRQINNGEWEMFYEVNPYIAGDVIAIDNPVGIGNVYYYGFHIYDDMGNKWTEVDLAEITVIGEVVSIFKNFANLFESWEVIFRL